MGLPKDQEASIAGGLAPTPGSLLVVLCKLVGANLVTAIALLGLATVAVLWCFAHIRGVSRRGVKVAVTFAFAAALVEWPFLLIWALYAFNPSTET